MYRHCSLTYIEAYSRCVIKVDVDGWQSQVYIFAYFVGCVPLLKQEEHLNCSWTWITLKQRITQGHHEQPKCSLFFMQVHGWTRSSFQARNWISRDCPQSIHGWSLKSKRVKKIFLCFFFPQQQSEFISCQLMQIMCFCVNVALQSLSYSLTLTNCLRYVDKSTYQGPIRLLIPHAAPTEPL